ncbi:MAG: exosortase C-terminal domain/associated protein EpsI [Verrucomicrobiota bacterium]
MITKRLLSVLLMLLIGFSTVLLLPRTSQSSPAGIALTLPNYIGDWIGEEGAITDREREVLAKDTQFARKNYTNVSGDRISVSIVLSGDDMTNSIHRPERCLPAQGWSVQASEKRVLPLANGKMLGVTRLRDVRPIELRDKSRATLRNVNYYWFVGYSDMTASHLTRTGLDLRDRLLHGYNQRWAYVTVAANVSEHLWRPERSEDETSAMLEAFIQKLVLDLKRPEGGALL